MLDHFKNQEVVITIALNQNFIMGSTNEIDGKIVDFNDKFIKLEDGTVVSIAYVRFIELK
ncbi:MAG: hypothetical protein WCP03_03365 [Candidatus Saccharibacteria bacterium]